FTGGGDNMEIRGTRQGDIYTNIGAGAEFRFARQWSVYGGANLLGQNRGTGYAGRIGINHRFCRRTRTRTERTTEHTEMTAEHLIAEHVEEVAGVKEYVDSTQEIVIVQVVARPVHIDLPATTFGFASSDIMPPYKAVLRRTIENIGTENIEHANITGHTCSMGPAEYNQRLSERRANAVANYMNQLGVSRERMTVTGRGLREPIATNETREGRAQNRRTEVEIIKSIAN
ncbi:MAG: OmpA family protein, partial [Elusimicrobia bacterium]|nr:OmpA family protein [Elusimicrobiota bacterium]